MFRRFLLYFANVFILQYFNSILINMATSSPPLDQPWKGLRWWPTCDEVLAHLSDLHSAEASTVVVTGANTGIGKEAASALARAGANVVLACRNVKKAEEVAKEIRSNGKSAVITLSLDLSSLKSVENFCAQLRQRLTTMAWPPLDCLLLNAGMFPFATKTTADTGCELTFAVNHLGHFYLSQLLMDDLKRAARENGRSSRVVVVSSDSHNGPLATKCIESREDVMKHVVHQSNAGLGAYGNSKLCNVLFAQALNERESSNGVVACALHPGALIGTTESRWELSCPIVFLYRYKIYEKCRPRGGYVSILHSLSR